MTDNPTRDASPWVAGKKSRILLDQICCVVKARLAGKMGEINATLWHSVLMEMLG